MLTEAELRDIEAGHSPTTYPTLSWCHRCWKRWPCPTVRLLSDVRGLRMLVNQAHTALDNGLCEIYVLNGDRDSRIAEQLADVRDAIGAATGDQDAGAVKGGG